MNYRRRLEATRERMAEHGLNALLIGQPANRAYLSGFAGHDDSAARSAGWVVLSQSGGYFLTGFNHFEAVQRTMRDLEPLRADGRITAALIDLLKKLGGRRVGFESSWVTVDLYQALREGLDAEQELQPLEGFVEGLREVKDAEERAILGRAIALTDRAFEEISGQLRPGQTEREVAWAIERRLRELGAQGMAFGPVVAAGLNAAVPHHEPGDDAIRPGEPIWIDLGARVDGYCGDLTRSFCLEHATPEYLETWNRVLAAERAALRGIRPGMTGREVDALARDVLEAPESEYAFGHGLGHGVGLQIHEGPWLLPTIDAAVPEGSVVTIEPGLYRPGWGGIRLEDSVQVTNQGAVVLSKAPKWPVRSPVGMIQATRL